MCENAKFLSLPSIHHKSFKFEGVPEGTVFPQVNFDGEPLSVLTVFRSVRVHFYLRAGPEVTEVDSGRHHCADLPHAMFVFAHRFSHELGTKRLGLDEPATLFDFMRLKKKLDPLIRFYTAQPVGLVAMELSRFMQDGKFRVYY